MELEELKDSISITDFIGKITALEKVGSRMVGLCPLHKEKTPSFYVDERRKSFYCFGCGKKGDIIEFVRLYKNLSFLAALKYLRIYKGGGVVCIPLKTKKVNSPQQRVILVNNLAAKIFNKELVDDDNGELSRVDKILNKYTIGYIPNSLSFLQDFKATLRSKFSPEAIEMSGLFNKHGKLAMATRIAFPIKNKEGDVVSFIGRATDETPSGSAKYLRTINNSIFNQSYFLYGIDLASTDILQEDEIVLVEGPRDVIAMHDFGYTNTVGLLGTSLDATVAERMMKKISQIVLVLDHDMAGMNATYNICVDKLLPHVTPNHTIEICDRLICKDPEETLKRYPDAAKHLLSNNSNIADYLFNYTLRKFNLSKGPFQVAAFRQELYAITNKIKHKDLAFEIKRYFSNMITQTIRKNNYDKWNKSRKTTNFGTFRNF